MMAKLFAMYPPRPDVEATMMAYLEETRKVHWFVLSHAMHRVTHQKREWLPSCYEILRAAAQFLREQSRLNRRLPIDAYNPWNDLQQDDINIDQWLDRQQEVLQAAQLLIPAGQVASER